MSIISRGMLCDLKQACRNELEHKWVALIGELPPPARDLQRRIWNCTHQRVRSQSQSVSTMDRRR
jgi:hypothetical protein